MHNWIDRCRASYGERLRPIGRTDGLGGNSTLTTELARSHRRGRTPLLVIRALHGGGGHLPLHARARRCHRRARRKEDRHPLSRRPEGPLAGLLRRGPPSFSRARIAPAFAIVLVTRPKRRRIRSTIRAAKGSPGCGPGRSVHSSRARSSLRVATGARMSIPDGTIWNWSEIVRQAREARARADRERIDARQHELNDAAARRKSRAVASSPPRLSLVRRRTTDER